jgi:hypothetical protein
VKAQAKSQSCPGRPRRRGRPDAGHPALRVCGQSALQLIPDHQVIAERIANPRASANRDIERRLEGLAARAQEERKGLVDILNQNIGFWTDIQVNDERPAGAHGQAILGRTLTPPD